MAKEKLADIYLNYKKDRRQYAVCYRQLVEQQPSPQTCILLGDAYMAIQVLKKIRIMQKPTYLYYHLVTYA